MVKTLASDEFEGRAPGSKGEELTVNYIRDQMQRIGLQPGNGDSWFQDVPMTETTADPTTVLTIRADGLMRGVAFSPDCAFIGSIAPTRNYTTLMQMSLTFQGGACTFGTQTLEGIAIYDPTLRTLQGVALVDTGTRVALLLARKS